MKNHIKRMNHQKFGKEIIKYLLITDYMNYNFMNLIKISLLHLKKNAFIKIIYIN